MRTPQTVLAASVIACFATASLLAGDGPASAKPTAEAFFTSLRKSAAAKDDAELKAALPAKLLAGWPDDEKTWRADVAARIADGEVVWVHESGDSAVARWKAGTPPSVRDMPFKVDGGRWVAASPWPYCVAGGELAKANGKGPVHVKLKARTTPSSYGASAWSFTFATGDVARCKNRADAWYCRCGKLHVKGALASLRMTAKLESIDGLQTGGDWMDEFVPKADATYVVACKDAGRRDFQAAIHVTACTDAALEFDWTLVAVAKNAPADIRAPQPLVSNDGADGVDQLCDKPGK